MISALVYCFTDRQMRVYLTEIVMGFVFLKKRKVFWYNALRKYMLNANPAEIKSQCHGHKKKRGDFSNLSRIISAEQIYNFNYIC